MLFTLHNIDKNKLEKENIVNVGLLLFQWHKFVKINRNIEKFRKNDISRFCSSSSFEFLQSTRNTSVSAI